MAVEQYRITDFKLSASDNLPITLKNGLAHLNLKAALNEGLLDADVDLNLDAATLDMEKKAGDNQLQQALHAALADVSAFSVNAKVSGPLDNYKVKMTSDLDKVMKTAVGKQVKRLTNEFQTGLQAGIMDKIEGPMANTAKHMSGLDTITQEITSRLNLGNDVLNSQRKLGF